MTDARWESFVAELANNAPAVALLLRRHVLDDNGMCTTCTTGGTGQRETRWPCTTHAVAHAAWQNTVEAEKQLRAAAAEATTPEPQDPRTP